MTYNQQYIPKLQLSLKYTRTMYASAYVAVN